MSITLNEIAYNIRNKLEGGRSHHNTYKSLDQIKFNVETYRALFLRRDIARNNRLREFEQAITLGVCRVTLGDSIDLDLPSHVLKSDPVPTPMRLQGRDGITYVASLNRKKTFPLVDYFTIFWNQFNKYTGKEVRAFILDDRIYLFGDAVSKYMDDMLDPDVEEGEFPQKDVRKIYVRGVFEKPSEVMLLKSYEIDPTNVDDQPYPMSADMVQRITEGLISGDLAMMDETQPQPQQQQPVAVQQPR